MIIPAMSKRIWRISIFQSSSRLAALFAAKLCFAGGGALSFGGYASGAAAEPHWEFARNGKAKLFRK
jgi:hypothetical protein